MTMTIQHVLQRITDEYGNTQSAVAERLQTTQATISRLIHGVHTDTSFTTALLAMRWLDELDAERVHVEAKERTARKQREKRQARRAERKIDEALDAAIRTAEVNSDGS